MHIFGRRTIAPFVVLLGLFYAVSAVAETTLKAVTFLPGNSAFVKPFQNLVNDINDQRSSQLKIDIIGGPEAIPPFELGKAVSIGAVDLAVLPVNYYRALAIEAEALQLLPERYHELRKTAAWTTIEQVHESAGLKLISVYGDTVPFYTYLVSSIDDLDFSGLRMRVTPVYSAFYKSLGATVTNLPPLEIHSALNAGAVDGFGWPAWDVTTFGWDEFVRYRIEPGFYRTAIAVVMNVDRWNSLSQANQKAIMDMVIPFERNISELMAQRTLEELEKQREGGMVVIDLGDAVVQIAETVYWNYLKEQSPEIIGRLHAATRN